MVAFGLALGVAWTLFPLLGLEVAALFLLSVAVTAWVSGPWTAVLTVLAAGLALAYWFIPPLYSVAVDSAEEAVSIVVFGMLGLGLSWLVAWLHAAKHKAQRNQRRREALLRVAHHLAEEVNPATVLRSLADEAANLFPHTAVTVYRWNAVEEVLLPLAASRLGDHFASTPLGLGEGLNGRVAATHTTCEVDDLQREIGPTAPLGRAGARASVAVPLLVEGRLLGTLATGALSPVVRFEAEDVAILELLASTASSIFIALERARLEGVLLAARTAQHVLNDQLAVVRGYAELVGDDPRLPPDLQPLVDEILTGAEQAAATVEQLRRTTRVEAVDNGGPGPVLDVGQPARIPQGLAP